MTLPPHERDAGSGLGNLWFWWGLMVVASVAVWIVLRGPKNNFRKLLLRGWFGPDYS